MKKPNRTAKPLSTVEQILKNPTAEAVNAFVAQEAKRLKMSEADYVHWCKRVVANLDKVAAAKK